MAGCPQKIILLTLFVLFCGALPLSADALVDSQTKPTPSKKEKHKNHSHKKYRKKSKESLTNNPQEQVSDQNEVSQQANKTHP